MSTAAILKSNISKTDAVAYGRLSPWRRPITKAKFEFENKQLITVSLKTQLQKSLSQITVVRKPSGLSSCDEISTAFSNRSHVIYVNII